MSVQHSYTAEEAWPTPAPEDSRVRDVPPAPEPAEPVWRPAAELRRGDVVHLPGDLGEVAWVEPVVGRVTGRQEIAVLFVGGYHIQVAADLTYRLADAATAAGWRRERERTAAANRLADDLQQAAAAVRSQGLPAPYAGATLTYWTRTPEDVETAAATLGTAVDRRDGLVSTRSQPAGRGELAVYILASAEEAGT